MPETQGYESYQKEPLDPEKLVAALRVLQEDEDDPLESSKIEKLIKKLMQFGSAHIVGRTGTRAEEKEDAERLQEEEDLRSEVADIFQRRIENDMEEMEENFKKLENELEKTRENIEKKLATYKAERAELDRIVTKLETRKSLAEDNLSSAQIDLNKLEENLAKAEENDRIAQERIAQSQLAIEDARRKDNDAKAANILKDDNGNAVNLKDGDYVANGQVISKWSLQGLGITWGRMTGSKTEDEIKDAEDRVNNARNRYKEAVEARLKTRQQVEVCRMPIQGAREKVRDFSIELGAIAAELTQEIERQKTIRPSLDKNIADQERYLETTEEKLRQVSEARSRLWNKESGFREGVIDAVKQSSNLAPLDNAFNDLPFVQESLRIYKKTDCSSDVNEPKTESPAPVAATNPDTESKAVRRTPVTPEFSPPSLNS